jgi:hypothetical protein
MKLLLLGLVTCTILFSCSPENKRVKNQSSLKPLVDIRDPKAASKKLCDLIQKLDQPKLSNSEYVDTQIKIEALYLGLNFAVKAGFYEESDILEEAKNLPCIL